MEKSGEESNIYKDFLRDFYSKKISDCFKRFTPILKELEEKLSKVIELKIEESPIQINYQLYEAFILSCVHIFRNCADHGIEPVEERLEAGKPTTGNISIRFKKIGKSKIQIAIKDDGKGITPGRIKKIAIKKGILTIKDAENLPDAKILQLVFHEDFSSKEEVTEFSGRGVGLGAVMEEVKKLKRQYYGGLKRGGSGTSFMISLPLFEE